MCDTQTKRALLPHTILRSLKRSPPSMPLLLYPVSAQHELSHFLAFKKPLHNRMLSIISNCVLVVPTATTFRKYHQEHHSHLVSIQPRTCELPTHFDTTTTGTTLHPT